MKIECTDKLTNQEAPKREQKLIYFQHNYLGWKYFAARRTSENKK